MNEYDSNRLSDLVKKVGYVTSEDPNDIDCYILNTCHIREKATEKVYHDIGRLKKNYKNKKKPTVLITGCVAQAENDEMLEREPYIDAVIGPQSYQNIPKILERFSQRKNKFNFTNFDVIKKFDKLNTIKNSDSKISSFITVQEGCDKFCNFCVVPYTRGPEYSRSPEEIVNEAKDLISNGVVEITLLGQNVNAYSYKRKKSDFRLSDLILELEKIKELKRIRYTTSHPKDMTNDLIKCHGISKKLAPFLHLPVQSGSSKILKNMNRKHTREEYLKTVKNLVNVRPNIKFSSDFIIGYPGETEKDFNETISLINEVKFINSFSFIYNQRPGTPASKLKSIDKETQHKRLVILQKLLADIQKEENHNQIGNLKKVLIENKMKNQGAYFGRTENFTPVITKNVLHSDIGKIIYVRIKDSNSNNLFGIKENIEREFAA
jgi:tRNA-2-methylthio-N6-dimethylallyladenosine synthase